MGPPWNHLFSMSFFGLIFDRFLATFGVQNESKMHPKSIKKSTQKSKQKKYPKSKKKESILYGKIKLTHETVVKNQRFRGSRKGSKNDRKNVPKCIKNRHQNHQKINQKTTLKKHRKNDPEICHMAPKMVSFWMVQKSSKNIKRMIPILC